jgi:hypothetical protein
LADRRPPFLGHAIDPEIAHQVIEVLVTLGSAAVVRRYLFVRTWPIGEVETRLAEVRLAGVQRPDFAPVEFFAF